MRVPTLPRFRLVAPLAGTLLLVLLLAPPAGAAGPGEDAEASSEERSLTGREIYQCVVENRFDSYAQTARLVSGDRGGSEQESEIRVTWRSFRGEEAGEGGVLSKTMVRYTEPFDLRYTGYLIVNNRDRSNDEFVYLPARRRVRRVNLRREAVFGTDFTLEDLVPREIEDASYERRPDRKVEGRRVHVVEATPKPSADSQYSRFVLHVERDRCVPLLTRYWNRKGVKVKELVAPPEEIEEHAGVWVPMELVMRNLRLESYTRFEVEELVPNPDLGRAHFNIRRLESH